MIASMAIVAMTCALLVSCGGGSGPVAPKQGDRKPATDDGGVGRLSNLRDRERLDRLASPGVDARDGDDERRPENGDADVQYYRRLDG